MQTATLKQKVYQTRLWRRIFKSEAETDHWLNVIERIIRWYEGTEPYIYPFPNEKEKETRFDLKKNALLTFIRIDLQHASFLKDLSLRPGSFAGLKVADFGAGPLPNLVLLKDCERYCVDPLLEEFRWLGFPLEEFEGEIHYVTSKCERVPLPSSSLDAIVSRDALDHVDDFPRTAAEMLRLLKPEGFIHILVNYHPPAASEPQALSDELILNHLAGARLRKVQEIPDAWGFIGGKSVLWSNLPDELLAPPPSELPPIDFEI